MIDPIHLTKYIIRPVLKDLGLYSENAERLILGTACKESDCGRYLRQLGDGPALGIYQMEPATHDDLWVNFLGQKPSLREQILQTTDKPYPTELVCNLAYATAMCRVHYLRVRDAIPDNLPGQANYWKRWYNSELGKGTPEEYISKWYQFIGAGGQLVV